MTEKTSISDALLKGICIIGRYQEKIKGQKEFLEDVFANLKKQDEELDPAGIQWSLSEFEIQKEFLVQVIKRVIEFKAWNWYRYVVEDEPAEKEALKLLSKLAEFGVEQVIKEVEGNARTLSVCNIHLGYSHPGVKTNCFICDCREPNIQEPKFSYKKIDFKTKFSSGKFYRVLPENELKSKNDVFKLLDKFCDEVNLKSMGNKWAEIDYQTAKKMVKNGLTYSLAYSAAKISTDNIIEENYNRLTSNFFETHLICCLSNTSQDPWGGSYSSDSIAPKWTFSVACIIAFRDEILFSLFLDED